MSVSGGPIELSTDASSSAEWNGCVSVIDIPPPSSGVGPATSHPLAIASSRRRSSTRSGTWLTSSASATAATVTVPVPSGCIATSTVTSR